MRREPEMAFEISNYSVKISRVAGADLSAKQYHFVEMDSAGLVTACNGAGDLPIGVLQNAPIAGQEAEVLVVGGTKVVAGEAVTTASIIGTSATGTAVAKDTTTNYRVGRVIDATGAADGVTVSAIINCASPTLQSS
jgi:hypothetical protein